MRFIKVRKVLELTAIESRSGLRRLVQSGQFPAPIQISNYRIAWRQEDIEHWMAERPTSTRYVKAEERA